MSSSIDRLSRIAGWLLLLTPASVGAQERPLEFRLTFDESVSTRPFSGRVYVM
jgi:hypothetical protein